MYIEVVSYLLITAYNKIRQSRNTLGDSLLTLHIKDKKMRLFMQSFMVKLNQ